jgi:hypothetical protein
MQYKISNYMSVDYCTSITELQFLGDETKLILYSQLVKPYNCREVTTLMNTPIIVLGIGFLTLM